MYRQEYAEHVERLCALAFGAGKAETVESAGCLGPYLMRLAHQSK